MNKNIFQQIQAIASEECSLISWQLIKKQQVNRSQIDGGPSASDDLIEPLKLTVFHLKLTCETAGEQSSTTYVLSPYQWLRAKHQLSDIIKAQQPAAQPAAPHKHLHS